MISRIQEALDDKDSFRFVVLGDIDRKGKVFSHVLSRAIEQRPDFIVLTGDSVRAGKMYQYRILLDRISQADIPMIFIPGNHDLQGEGYKSFMHLFGPLNFHFDVGNYRFIIINSNERVLFDFREPFISLPSRNGNRPIRKGIASEQIDHLKDLIAPDKKHFIFLHVPPRGVWRHHAFHLNAAKFTRLLADNAPYIERVFSGHIHGYSRKEYLGVTYLISAGAGGEFHQHDADVIERFNFVLVDVSRNETKDVVFFCDL
jgi:3',5'-cyclic AMP phosphodiesterase CpdA